MTEETQGERQRDYHVPPGWEGKRVRVDFTAIQPYRHTQGESMEFEGTLLERTPLGVVVKREDQAPLLIAYRAINLIELDPPSQDERFHHSWTDLSY